MWQPQRDNHLWYWGKTWTKKKKKKSQHTVNMLQADVQLADCPRSTIPWNVQVLEHLKTVSHLQVCVPVKWKFSLPLSFYHTLGESWWAINTVLLFTTMGNMLLYLCMMRLILTSMPRLIAETWPSGSIWDTSYMIKSQSSQKLIRPIPVIGYKGYWQHGNWQ